MKVSFKRHIRAVCITLAAGGIIIFSLNLLARFGFDPIYISKFESIANFIGYAFLFLSFVPIVFDAISNIYKNISVLYPSNKRYTKFYFSVPSGFILDLLLPPSAAEESIDNLTYLYFSRWQPRYKTALGKFIYCIQLAGVVYSFHAARLLKLFGVINKLFGRG